jgi:hypothetical protein
MGEMTGDKALGFIQFIDQQEKESLLKFTT